MNQVGQQTCFETIRRPHAAWWGWEKGSIGGDTAARSRTFDNGGGSTFRLRRDVETFEGDVAYISNLWIPADPLYTFRVRGLYTSCLSSRTSSNSVLSSSMRFLTRNRVYSSFLYSPSVSVIIRLPSIEIITSKLKDRWRGKSIGKFLQCDATRKIRSISEKECRSSGVYVRRVKLTNLPRVHLLDGRYRWTNLVKKH